jgi:hypothetical protein
LPAQHEKPFNKLFGNTMTPLPNTSTDHDLIAFVDRWAILLEKESYVEAYQLTDHDPSMRWTPELIREVIKSYGDASPTQRVTLAGKPTDISQRKEVTRWPQNRLKGIGEVWYDLNIDGFASDLTATFWIVLTPAGLILRLNDIHVM